MAVKPKIMIIDDDVALCDLYKTTFEGQGYDVIEATNGEEGLTKAVEEKPDLILLDIMMPQIHGLYVLDILKATPETKDIKVIALTALSDEETVKKAKALGALDYIVKSQWTITDIIKKVKEAVAS